MRGIRAARLRNSCPAIPGQFLAEGPNEECRLMGYSSQDDILRVLPCLGSAHLALQRLHSYVYG